MKVKDESEKAGSKLNIQKTKITAYSTVTSWQIDGETMEPDIILLGSKITTDGVCSHEIKDTYSLEEKLSQTSVEFSSVQSLSHVRLFATL